MKKTFFALLFCQFLIGFAPLAAVTLAADNAEVHFFYSRTCEECRDIKENLVPYLARKYPGQVDFRFYEISDPSNYALLSQMEGKYGRAKNPPPTIFVGGKLLDGTDEIKNGLDAAIARVLKEPAETTAQRVESAVRAKIQPGGTRAPVKTAPPAPRVQPAAKKEKMPARKEEVLVSSAAACAEAETGKTGFRGAIIEKFKYLGVATVIAGGLIDGINPCAFSTLIIFVIYLTFSGYKRGAILRVGLIFTLGVFIAYLSIGLGLMEFVLRLKFLPVLSRVLLLIFGVLALVFALLSIYDYFKIRAGKLKEIALQLPDKIKARIKDMIWKKSSQKYILASTFVIGMLIGVLEFPCTGQIYFPIILCMREVPSLRVNALGYLVLYNVMFIIPLLIVFALVYFGANSGSLMNFLEKRSGLVKLLTSLLFFALGGTLIFFGIG